MSGGEKPWYKGEYERKVRDDNIYTYLHPRGYVCLTVGTRALAGIHAN
jgi:hypothetical protein